MLWTCNDTITCDCSRSINGNQHDNIRAVHLPKRLLSVLCNLIWGAHPGQQVSLHLEKGKIAHFDALPLFKLTRVFHLRFCGYLGAFTIICLHISNLPHGRLWRGQKPKMALQLLKAGVEPKTDTRRHKKDVCRQHLIVKVMAFMTLSIARQCTSGACLIADAPARHRVPQAHP